MQHWGNCLQFDLFGKVVKNHTNINWDSSELHHSWQKTVRHFLDSSNGVQLVQRINNAEAEGGRIFPSTPFYALACTPLDNVKVVILGQDPYHGEGQAHGLAFSVPATTSSAKHPKTPPSLQNIFKEVQATHSNAKNTDLTRWAKQGVLLLNTCLTVAQGQPASHTKWGWQALTDALLLQTIRYMQQKNQALVLMLWGNHAQSKASLCTTANLHLPTTSTPTSPVLVLKANHPSPLSALRPPMPFIGCNHFVLANDFLLQHGLSPIVW